MSEPEPFVVSTDTRAAQATAIDGGKSVWVSANAGSGKTYVLTRRVIRLLLDGVDPARILCLTYTKAAAANMQNRIFSELAEWVGLSNEKLAARIVKMIGADEGVPNLSKARRLFAEAVETPGGLRIQTIHAFCEQLLHLFPLEANVPASFAILDETEARALLAEAIDETLRNALAEPPSILAPALARVAQDTSLSGLFALLPELTRHVDRFDPSNIRLRLGLRPDETVASIDRQTIEDGIPKAEWPSIAAVLAASASKNDQQAAERLHDAIRSASDTDKADTYRGFFLTQGLEPRARLVTKAVADSSPTLADDLVREQARVFLGLDRRRAAAAAERSEALLLLARDVTARLRLKKHRRALLDFDDLIERTATLLDRAEAAWVLFKLDGGIDHLLVDEAQDTSPAQWAILKALTADFFSGETAVRRKRTVFAVGDEKQSIYSFQGADPREFGAARAHFEKAVTNVEGGFAAVELKMSFRSTNDVLGAVDAVFADAERRKGLSALDDVPTVHDSARGQAPGLVEIWPPEIVEAADDGFSDEGIDAPTEISPEVRLARRIAGRIALWQRDRATFEDDGKLIQPGEIMILVRRRNAFFEAVIRALKQAGVPVAGADRLTLTDHIAVMDLIALGQFALLPQDDLTLASLLKSPLCGLNDDDLLLLAPGRSGSLWRMLERSAGSRHQAVFAKLTAWRALAAEHDCFGFYATVLGRDHGRHDLLQRLGPDAGEAIDVFLSDALAYGAKAPPTLSGFLAAVLAENRTVKRDMDAAGNAVRVMTVHAAKGLEARIVFLADTFSQPMAQHDSPLLRLEGTAGFGQPEALIWSPIAQGDPAIVRAERERRRESAWDEYRRLLYVGMTRARDRLYVGGYRGVREVKTPVWYAMIEAALGGESARQVPAEDGQGDVLQWRSKSSRPSEKAGPQVVADKPLRSPLPDWLKIDAPHEAPALPPLRPSSLLGQGLALAVTPGPADSAARRRGVLLHRLFELLPDVAPVRRREAGLALLRQNGLPDGGELLDTVLTVFNDPAIEPLFGPDSRAEVAISGTCIGPEGQSLAISGKIDRLVMTAGEVHVVDLKTGRPPADPRIVPEAIVRQVAAYRSLLQQIYPGRLVRCHVIWTAMPRIVEVGPVQLDAVISQLFAEQAPLVRKVTRA